MPERFPDQALGLRRMFESDGARVVPVVAGEGERPGRAALKLARKLNRQGHRCLIIDATRGDLARQLGLAVRYELRHVGLGDRRLSQVVLEAEADLRVLPAARGLAELAVDQRPVERLSRLARDLPLSEDWVLIAADAPLASLAAAFAPGGEVAVACGAGRAGRTRAYALMKRMARAKATNAFRLLCEDPAAAHALGGVAERFLGVSVAWGGEDPRSWRCASLQR